MPHAGTRNDMRSARCEPSVPPRRLIRRLGRGILRVSLANATEPPERPAHTDDGEKVPKVEAVKPVIRDDLKFRHLR